MMARDKKIQTRVLIIKLSAFGDVVISTPHVQVLMDIHKDDDVTLITSETFKGLFSAFAFTNIYGIDGKSFKELLKTIWFVFSSRFDVVYDLQTNDRSAILTAVSFARVRVGMGKRFIYTHHESSIDYSRHVYDRTNDLFRELGFPQAPAHPVIGISDNARRKVQQWLENQGLGRDFVIMHAGSSSRWLSKRWPAEYFRRLARRFTEKGVSVVWVGADEEVKLNAGLSASVGINATGIFVFEELVVLGGLARAAIVNDSGPMHLLSAAGIPVYAFFGPTDFSRSHAVGQKHNVLFNPVDCSPCFLQIRPPSKKHLCMAGLLPEKVFERISTDLGIE